MASQTYTIDERNLERQRMLARVLDPPTARFLRELKVVSNPRCLDLGCGIGETTRLIQRIFGSPSACVGLEYDPALVRKAQQLISDESIRFEQGDASRLPFEDESFDVVFCRYLLIHSPDPVSVLKEMRRVTAAGGLTIALEPDFSFHKCHPPNWAYDKMPELLGPLFQDAFIGTKLVHLFQTSGLSNIATEAWCKLETGRDGKRLWTLSMEAMAPALIERGIASESQMENIIEEYRRVEEDSNIVLLSNPLIFVSARK